jgi:hypothetical protein
MLRRKIYGFFGRCHWFHHGKKHEKWEVNHQKLGILAVGNENWELT